MNTAEDTTALSLNGCLILLVEADTDTRSTMTEILEVEGFEVLPASDPREAVGKAQRFMPQVIVSELGFRAPDGIALIARLRADEHLRNCWIIVYSGWTAYRAQALGAGADVFLEGPAQPEELLAAVRQGCARAGRI